VSAEIKTNVMSNIPTLRRPSLFINAISNWCPLGVNLVIAFLLTPILFAYLGEKRFGMWMLGSSLVGYFGLLRLGVGSGVFRYVPLFRGKGDQDKVSSIVSTGLAFYTVLGVFVFVVAFFFAGLIADFFQGGRELAILIRLLGLAAALECPSLILDTVIRSYEKFVFANLMGIFTSLMRAGLLLFCVFMGYGLVSMGWVIVICTFLAFIGIGMIFRSCCKGIGVDVKRISFSSFKMLICFGVIVLVASAGFCLTFESPKQIIGKVISLKALGLFSIVAVLIRYYQHLIQALTKVLMPRFTYLSGQNADNEIRRLFLRGSKCVAIIAGVFALLLWIVGPPFLKLWVKNENINRVIPALTILVAGMLVLLSHYTSTDLLFSLGQQRKLAVLSMIEGIFVLGLSLVLSYEYGMTGVAVGVSIPLILIRGVVQTIYVCRLIKVGFWVYYTECIIKPLIIAVVLAVVSYRLGVARFANNWLLLFLISALLLLTYGSAIYTFAIRGAEKQRVDEYFLGTFKYVRYRYLTKRKENYE
jgi:O-antigen/teichoic acid export membrane protein